MYKRYYKIEGDKITDNSIEHQGGWIEKEFTDKQTYYNWGNISRLKIVDEDIEMKNADDILNDDVAAMSRVSKLDAVRAMKSLDNWKDVKAFLKANEDFEDEWYASNDLDLQDETLLAALQLLAIDVDAVKRKIIEINEE